MLRHSKVGVIPAAYGILELLARAAFLPIIPGNNLLPLAGCTYPPITLTASIRRPNRVSHSQRGFTLIELVMVIVILGVLGAVAIPRFVDLRSDAQTAATQAVAGALSSASAINASVRRVNPSQGVAITDCSQGGSLLEGGLPRDYSLGGALPLAIPAGSTVNCTLTGPNGTTASAALTGT
jgi:prepilin-type N-terminal cleavage/methylation domain-containing protein